MNPLSAQGAKLVCLDVSMLEAPPEEMEIPLRRDEQTIGRERSCTICLRSPTLSRRHAKLFPVARGWAIQDLHSTNGVYVNGRRVSAAWLNDGDEIRIGPVPLRYKTDAATAPAEEEPSIDQTILVSPTAKAAAAAPRVERRRLLVCDDSRQARDWLVDIALHAEFDVLGTDDPAEFQDQLDAFAPSAVLVLLTEADTDGAGTIDVIVNNAPKVPVILVGNRAAEAMGAAVAQAKRNALALREPLPYPCAPLDLLAALEAIPKPEQPLSAGDLIRAIQAPELVVFYQPKIDLRTGRPVGAEALVRWRHPERGLVPPNAFIPLAEETGQISKLTYFVLDDAIATARRLAPKGWDLKISVNLSVKSLVDLSFTRNLVAMLDQGGVPVSSIVFEITESVAMSRVGLIQEVLRGLRDRGFGLSLDDFGTGYSSLEGLHSMPFTELKIDKQFVLNLTADAGARAITESTISLAHSLGLEVVAEGVETGEAMELLRTIGCDLAQGYYISRPIPAAEFEAWLER